MDTYETMSGAMRESRFIRRTDEGTSIGRTSSMVVTSIVEMGEGTTVFSFSEVPVEPAEQEEWRLHVFETV